MDETETRRKWLMSLSECDACALSPADNYDRIRYLRFEESRRFLTEAKMKPSPHWNRDWPNKD